MYDLKVIDITLEEVKQKIESLINESTSFNCSRYHSMESAVAALAKEKLLRINDFTVLDQKIIDEQKKEYDGYLDGASVGDLVWGDSEMWVSQQTVESWLSTSGEKLTGEHEDIEDIADYICDDLIVTVLKKYNECKTGPTI